MTIDDNAVIAADSLLTMNLPASTIAGGVPVSVIARTPTNKNQIESKI